MPYVNRILLALVVTVHAGCSSGVPRDAGADDAGRHGSAVERDISRVRAATAAFRSLDAAVAAGYPQAVLRCISHPQDGAMGHHHMNRALLDDRIELERPEILLYSRTATGEYVLNGVEYIVPYSALPRDATPPVVMGQPLKRSDALELWYLHVWIWTENQAGLFADWNPAVECAS